MGVANDRETGYGMIAPGSHPEFDKDTPLDAMVRGAKQVASNVGDFLNTHFGTKHTPKPVTNTQPDQPGKQ
jgi:hypothetical protein